MTSRWRTRRESRHRVATSPRTLSRRIGTPLKGISSASSPTGRPYSASATSAEAAKPVMEGKGVLFKRFADIDVFDVELDTDNAEALIQTVEAMEPTFGGINLEDIAAPECFEVERRLSEKLDIPVFHDDQHGTAIISGRRSSTLPTSPTGAGELVLSIRSPPAVSPRNDQGRSGSGLQGEHHDV